MKALTLPEYIITCLICLLRIRNIMTDFGLAELQNAETEKLK